MRRYQRWLPCFANTTWRFQGHRVNAGMIITIGVVVILFIVGLVTALVVARQKSSRSEILEVPFGLNTTTSPYITSTKPPGATSTSGAATSVATDSSKRSSTKKPKTHQARFLTRPLSKIVLRSTIHQVRSRPPPENLRPALMTGHIQLHKATI